jgi:hypothetical protein
VSFQAFFLTLAFVSGSLAPQEAPGWNDYKPSSLKDAWRAGTILEGSDHTFETTNVKFAVEGTFTGRHREVGTARRQLLRRWAKVLNHPPQVAEMFEHEIEVRSDGELYWLPLQNALLQPFVDEARDGTRLRLFIMYVGATREDRLFVVNEFEALVVDASPPVVLGNAGHLTR